MNEPLSPSGDKQCFNCGKDLQNSAAFCPHCGAALPTQGSGFIIAARLIGALLLGGLALLFGAAGACFMFFAIIGGLYDLAPDAGLGMIGLVLLGLAALCVWSILALIKKREDK